MIRTLTILFLFASHITTAQSVRLPSGDSITYDFSGATRKGSPGLYKYFTTDINDDARITREVADFNGDSVRRTGNGKGWKGMINFQQEYLLDSIKFYDRSGSRDTIWLYTFDRNNAPKWDTIINTENYTPDYLIISCGSCSGSPVITKINANASDYVQFVFVVVRKTNLFSGLWPNVSNISFYGRPTGNADTTYNLAHWVMNDWTARPIDSIVGNFNLPNQQDTTWHDTATAVHYDRYRTFDQMFSDNQAVKHGYAFDLGGAGYSPIKYNQAMARRGNYQFAAIFNDNPYYKFQLDSIGHSVTKGWGINTIYDDPQLPQSYSRVGEYMQFHAAVGGGCATCPSPPTYNGTLVKGLGYLKGMGTDNEPAWFFPNSFKTPIMSAAKAIGVYDYVKLGDPNMPVLGIGLEAYNYDDGKAFIMALKLYARSRNIKIDGISFHGIHSLKTDSFQVIPNTSQQIGNHGVSVGYWDDWRKNIHFVLGLRREAGNPNLIVQLDEDTHQKGVYKRKPTDAGETFTVSQLATPRFTIGGVTQDAYTSHAVAATQDEFIATASPLFKHYWYQIVDDQLYTENPNYDGIDQSNGKFDRPLDFTDKPQSWPADYATVSRRKRLGRYRFVDSVYTEFRGLHVFKYVHVSNPDSVMYEFAVLDSTGTDIYILSGLTATTGRLITPSFTSRQATQSTVTITGGTYTLNADPLPRALIVYEPGGGPEPNLPPEANAGSNVTITLPTSSTTLNGSSSSDPDGTISTYLWTKTSGPATYAISTPNNVSTNVINLVEGTYVFTLTVTDDDGATDQDTVTVTVNAAPVVPTPGRFIRMKKKIKPPR